MARKNKARDTTIIVAIIGAIGLAVAGFYQGPLANTQYQNRPIIDVSFGGLGTNYPTTELERDETGYYTSIIMRNRGHDDGKITIIVQSTNAKIWSSFYKTWDYKQSAPFALMENSTLVPSKVYILPDENQNRFEISLLVEEPSDKQPFQKATLFRPTILTYEKSDEIYKLVDQR